MSVAAAEPVEDNDGEAPAPSPTGRKKLVILAASALLVIAVAGGGGAVVWKNKKAAAAAAAQAEAADGDGEAGASAAPAARPAPRKQSHKGPPAFLPLDPFVVNLADRESERYAQIGITLELDDPKFGDQIKAYMPAIRNGILMVLAHKSSQELLSRAGKEKLALEIVREAVRPLGIELEDENEPAAKDRSADEEKTAKTPLEESPVRHVHFSSFIIQ
jgi:flagellar FliL protein